MSNRAQDIDLGITKRLEGYRQRALHEWSMWRHAKNTRRKVEKFEAWLKQLQQDPPAVLLGANFAEYGGVRGHLLAIQKHSHLNVALAPPDQLMAAGLKPYDLKTTCRKAFFDFPASGIQVAHSHVFPWFVRWCRKHQKNGIRWIHTYHNLYFPEFARGELEPWQQEVNEVILTEAPDADVRISVSKWQQTYLREQHGIETEYIPNGVDVGLCDAADADRFSRNYHLDDYILYVGRNDPVKNPSEFVRLAQQMSDHTFVMIGDGLSVAALARDWDVQPPSNLLVFAALPHCEVLDAVAGCRAVVITSLREGMPTLALEGMTLRKPIVVTGDAGCVEAVAGGRFGYIYEAGNLDDLVEQTRRALRTELPLDQARQRIVDEFDWRAVAQQLDRIYQG